MSDRNSDRSPYDRHPASAMQFPARRSVDRGMTLPELMIAVSMVGLLMAVLASAIIVTIRQESSTEGRFNVARAEQSVGMWLPGDLASAAAVSTEPDWTPCSHIELEGEWIATGQTCPDLGLAPGSNALLIGWSMTDAAGNVTNTNVSYYFSPSENGLFELTRIECTNAGGGWSCDTLVVLSELPGPPAGTPWEPGRTKPDWVIKVSAPLAADGVTEDDVVVGDTEIKNAKRVIVTVNGGGSSDGAGGGTNQISITAGGTNRNVIDGTSLQGAPSFAEARSLCGGPITLLVDESNSIGNVSGALTQVKSGVREFITALIGTPVKLQIIGFHTYSHVLGTSDWHKYYDMTNDADVTALLAAVDTLRDSWSGTNGGTNWEEAFFRTFYAADGTTVEPPESVVFFTDGVPTFDRLVHRTSPGVLPAQPPDPGPGWPDSTGSSYSQVAFDRTDYIARQFRSSVRLIGVGIGGANTGTSDMLINPGTGYHWLWERAYRQYQQYPFQSRRDFESISNYQSRRDFEQVTAWQSTRDFEQVTGYRSTRDYEQAQYQSRRDFEVRNNSSSSWRDATPTEYYVGWASNTSNRRINSTRGWYDVTQTEYNNYSGSSSSNWQVLWNDVTPTVYYGGNTSAGTSDGFRVGNSSDNGTRAEYSVTATEYTNWSTASGSNSSNWYRVWGDIMPAAYYASPGGNTSSGEADGFRVGNSSDNGTRTAYNVSQSDYNSWSTAAGGTSSNWFKVWTDITPTAYYTGNTVAGESDGFRIGNSSDNGVRGSWYDITPVEYTSYSTQAGAVTSGASANFQMVWGDTTPTAYYTNNTPASDHSSEADGWRINPTNRSSWYDVTVDEWKTYSTAPGAVIGSTGNWRVNTSGSPIWIPKATYDANNTVSGNSDGWHDTGSREYVSSSSAQDWIEWTGSRDGINSNQFRSTKIYAPPYDVYESPQYDQDVPNWEIIGRLIGGGGTESFEEASPQNGPYTNVETADLYRSSNFAQLPVALKAIALGECGGTLTLQTRMNGTAVADPFVYQNSAQFDFAGAPITIDPKTVTTNRQFTTGNFDFSIDSGLYRDVVILPANYSDLGSYSPAGWTCRAGTASRSFELVDIPDAPTSVWKGIKVRVAANEAVSCTQAVTR